ncbi:ABC transporter permease [Metabacillus dongyingensis]|uniref:ABC transporter permease n=1 Tax=Metabacillus dongyingensis TaxID=2874282 RepID=UPI001CBEE68E|nr:ABC transporter permease [Metabacillus dongyingensis]UAL53830.1 ABC transporter permease [Metabacillus dongyingensis]
MMMQLLSAELLKLRKTKVLSLLFVSPLFAGVLGFKLGQIEGISNEWLSPLLIMVPAHALILLPLMIGILTSFLCRYEHLQGGWKQLLSLPVSRVSVFMSKWLMITLLILINQLLFMTAWILVGAVKGYSDPFPADIFIKLLTGGFLATLPLAALFLWVSMAWTSFAAPLALNVMFTLPNIMIINSEKIGPYYPWAQPFLAMMPQNEGFFITEISFYLSIACGFVCFFTGSFYYIKNKAV